MLSYLQKKIQYKVTQCDYRFILKKWPGGHELIKRFRVMKQANTNTSLRTYTCTSYFPEYNKCK
jgi:hypothetical protein